jgi:hypothetical protein
VAQVGEHSDTQRNKHVTGKGELGDSDVSVRGKGPHFVRFLGFLHGCSGSAEGVRDHINDEDSHDHEEAGLEGVGPGRGARASGEDVGENDEAHDEAGKPGWNRSVGRFEEFREGTGNGDLRGDLFHGDAVDCLRGADDADEEIRDDEEDQDGKEEVADSLRIKACSEILDLGDVTITFTDGPEFDADEEEAGGMDEAGGRGHESVGADAPLEGFAGRADEGKGGHGRSEDRHEEHEGADGVGGDEVIA